MIKRELDEETGIIYVSGAGAWTREDVDAHYDALRRMILALRAARRPIRVLSDLTRAARQSPTLEAHILGQIDRTYQSGDRVAFLAANADDKNYVKMIVGKAHAAVFSSRLAAEMWLQLDDDTMSAV